MAFSRKSLLAFLLAALAWCVQPAAANDVYEATVSDMLAEQAQRIQQLETHLASLQDNTKLHADGCDDGCDHCPGVIAGAELTFLKAHSNALTGPGPGIGGTIIPSFDYEVAPRAWLGYQFAGGLGLRATWWGYDQGLPASSFAAGFGLEATTVDLEVTDAISLGKWDLLASGGIRYARLRQDIGPSFLAPIPLSRDFEGLGGTFGLSVRRGLGGTNLALIGSARGSLVFGESFDNISTSGLGGGPPGLPLVGVQRTTGIFEMRLGVEWSRELSNGARFYTQTVYEAQYWQSAQLFNGAGGMDVGFTGVAFNIGLAR
jgi:hypothetical protein